MFKNNFVGYNECMDIICRKTKCKFNDKYTCRATSVDINKNILCATFENDIEKPEVDVSKNIFERTPEYSQHRPSKDANIKCTAKCLFNNKCECEANGITINCLKDKPYCITFLQK